MTETDHGDFPIAVHMTSQLLHVLLVLCPHHVKLTLPTSSKINTNECDGIPSVDMSNITDVCADTHHRDVSLPHRTQHVLDTCIHTCPLSPTSTGRLRLVGGTATSSLSSRIVRDGILIFFLFKNPLPTTFYRLSHYEYRT